MACRLTAATASPSARGPSPGASGAGHVLLRPGRRGHRCRRGRRRRRLGPTDVDAAGRLAGEDVASFIVQQQCVGWAGADGGLADAAHANRGLFVTLVDPVSLALLEAPGGYGADIVTAEGQQFGIPLWFGGTSLGRLASRMDAVRQLPGRLVGATRERRGRGCVLTLQARERHMRRERADRDICTTRPCARWPPPRTWLRGAEGLREVAERSAVQARHLVATLEAAGLAERRFTLDLILTRSHSACRTPPAATRRWRSRGSSPASS